MTKIAKFNVGDKLLHDANLMSLLPALSDSHKPELFHVSIVSCREVGPADWAYLVEFNTPEHEILDSTRKWVNESKLCTQSEYDAAVRAGQIREELDELRHSEVVDLREFICEQGDSCINAKNTRWLDLDILMKFPQPGDVLKNCKTLVNILQRFIDGERRVRPNPNSPDGATQEDDGDIHVE